MAETDGESFVSPPPVRLTSWPEVVKHLESFSAPKLEFDLEGDVKDTAWVFRGVNDADFELEPSIERCAKDTRIGWAALEAKVSEEFKYRAHLFLAPPLATEGYLPLLALMQHYGIPTRLLDFTLSPFVALYFAARHCGKHRKYARVWAMDSRAIHRASARVVARARERERKRRKEKGRRLSFHPDDAASDRDVLEREADVMRRRNEEVLAATGTFRRELSRQGCVCVASPPSVNPRLANQQGLFLFNGAEDRSFARSLKMMMIGDTEWRQDLDIPAELLPEIERRLFQMNIHEQSLFPDLGGLAGIIKQRIRLHWK